MRFAHAANFSSTNVSATRLAVSASGKVLMASKIWSAICQAKAVIPSGVEESRCITLRYQHGTLRLRGLYPERVERAPLRTQGPTNPTATEDDVAIVKHRCLPWSHSPLRIMQSHMGMPVFELRQRSACSWVAITNLRRHFEALGGRSSRDAGLTGVRRSMKPLPDIANPIHPIDLEFIRRQVVSISHNHAICRRIEINHIARPRRTTR